MSVADEVALDLCGEHVTHPAQRDFGGHREVRECALLVSDAQAIHKRAGIAGHSAVVTVGVDEKGAEIAVLDTAQPAQHHQIETVGGARLGQVGQERQCGEQG